MEWFRFYDEVLDDPKVQRLPAPLFREWINVLCLCNRNDPRGQLPEIDDVAFGLRCSTAKARAIVRKLADADLLVTDDGVTHPHGWHKRQRVSDNVADRVAKSRARKQVSNVTGNTECNVTSNDLETLPHVRATDTDTDTDTELTTPNGVVEAQAPETRPSDPDPTPKPAKRAAQVPADWQPCEGLRRWCQSEGFADADIAREVPKFVDYYRAKGEPRKDWDASFRNWMRNAEDFGSTFAKPPKTPPNLRVVDHNATTIEEDIAKLFGTGGAS